MMRRARHESLSVPVELLCSGPAFATSAPAPYSFCAGVTYRRDSIRGHPAGQQNEGCWSDGDPGGE